MNFVTVFIAAIIFGALGGKKDMLDAIAIMHGSHFYYFHYLEYYEHGKHDVLALNFDIPCEF